MAKDKKTLPPIWYVVIAVIIWSTGGMFIKVTALDAYQVTFFRSLLAGLTVLLITRKAGLRINAFGLMCSVIYAALLFLFVWATKHTTAANAIFLQYTAPIYILILAPFVIGEKFHLRDLITVIFCLLGMSLFFVGDLTVGDINGNIAALFSGVFLGLYIMLLKHPRAVDSGQWTVDNAGAEPADLSPENSDIPHSAFHTPHSPTSPIATVIYGNFILAILTLPAGVAALPTITPKDLFAVAFLGIVQIGIAYILFIKGVTRGVRPLDASIIGFIEPLLNPVWVFLIIGERPSQWALVGGTIIIATVGVHTVASQRATTTTS